MPQGVYVFDVIRARHIDQAWVRNEVLQVSTDRYKRLRAGRYHFTREEASKIIDAFKAIYGIEPHQLFDWDAEILPRGRRRRTKGTVTKEKGTVA